MDPLNAADHEERALELINVIYIGIATFVGQDQSNQSCVKLTCDLQIGLRKRPNRPNDFSILA